MENIQYITLGAIQLGYTPTRFTLCAADTVQPCPSVAEGTAPYPFALEFASGDREDPLRVTQADLVLTAHSLENTRIFLQYSHPQTQVEVTVCLEAAADGHVIRQTNRLLNKGAQPIVVTRFSSARLCVMGIEGEGEAPWREKDRFLVRFARNTWQGEAQWRAYELQELGVFRSSTHDARASFRFGSQGSWTTDQYLPLLFLEDTRRHTTWFVQHEPVGAWEIDIALGCADEQPQELLCVTTGMPGGKRGHWCRRLEPGAVYDAATAAYGVVEGGVEQAVAALNAYRRSRLKRSNRCAPLVFNDYMNCHWAEPSAPRTKRLIDAVAGLGMEYFCLDAGWYKAWTDDFFGRLGDWEASPDRFAPEGLQGIFDYIRARGMKPGVWMELEVCSKTAAVSRRPEEWFLHRDGYRIYADGRYFLNVANEQVRAYLMEKIAHLYAMGVRYIKNDDNSCVGAACDCGGFSGAAGLEYHTRWVHAFYRELGRRYPDLRLENCASGGMREDYGILPFFDWQSITDNEDYRKCPSIINGTLAALLPEQAGIWAYPFPQPYADRTDETLGEQPAYRQAMADGEQTIFTMINGLCGSLCLSGRIDWADEKNRRLIQSGVDLYRREQTFIAESNPVWPLGMVDFQEDDAWAAQGLVGQKGTRMLLAIWRLGSPQDHMTLPLPKWEGARVRQLYPPEDGGTRLFSHGAALEAVFPQRYQARLYELQLPAVDG